MEELKYPIGSFAPAAFNLGSKLIAMETLASFPEKIKNITAGLTDDQLDQPYRPEGWTIRQLVHHCADSHMNAFLRFKLTLTEVVPHIKPYNEAEWAKSPDYEMDITPSIFLLEGLHQRWLAVLLSMSDEDFDKTYFHPHSKKEFTLAGALLLYAWHCDHHFAHIAEKIKREAWDTI